MQGSHLKLDCYGCAREKLADTAAIYRLLEAFPEKLGLAKNDSPAVFEYPAEDSREAGVSGVIIFAETHLALHTFPAKAEVSVNIFSRNGFDTSAASQSLISFFGAAEHQISETSREQGELNAFQIP